MASPIINTRADLDAIAGTPAHAAYMDILKGSIHRFGRDDAQQVWTVTVDTALIERFGFSLADFPDLQPPVIPQFVGPTPGEVSTAANKLDTVAAVDLAMNDVTVQWLLDHTPAEAAAFATEARFPSMPSATERALIGKIFFVLSVLVRKILRNGV